MEGIIRGLIQAGEYKLAIKMLLRTAKTEGK
jgi:hypothetical protein